MMMTTKVISLMIPSDYMLIVNFGWISKSAIF
jgi:hypothetical protein